MHRHPDGSCPVYDFFKALPDGDKAKVMRTLVFIDANKSLVTNQEKFKQLESSKKEREAFYEIKIHQIRIGCIREALTRLILLHAWNKKDYRWSRGEKEKLYHMYDLFEEQRRKK